MLIYAMSVSVDGYTADRDGGFGWGGPSEELFAFHLDRVRGLAGYLLGRRLYEAMLPWEADPAMRSTPLHAEFADVWTALPKVVFSRTLGSVDGRARLADRPLAEEVERVTAVGDAEIGGPGLAAAAVEAGLVDEFRLFRHPVVVGGGTPYLPAVTTPLTLDLLETRAFDDRVVYERYARVTRPGAAAPSDPPTPPA